MRIFFFISLFSIFNALKAQDTMFLDKELNLVFDINSASNIVIMTINDDNHIYFEKYNIDWVIQEQINYSDYKKKIKHGIEKVYFDDGKLKAQINYNEGKLHGALTSYFDDGKIRRSDLYENDSLVKGACYNSIGEEIEYFPYFVNAEFEGGMQKMYDFLRQNIKYPKKAKKRGVQGVVYVSFVVDKKGQITNVKVVKSLCYECDKEATRIIEIMPRWIPGKIDGELVNIRYTLPISFKLK